MPLALGAAAPDFTLQRETGETITLADARRSGGAVLIFYPKDETPGCTKQLCTARDDAALYAAAGVTAYGVNGDSAASHQKFIQKHHLTMPLLIDPGLVTAKAYDAVMGIGPLKIVNRTVVGISRDGTIVFYERGMPATKTILAAFEGAPAP